MVDWLRSMVRTYEFYEVDPGTWKDKRPIRSITSAKISRDLQSATLETASLNATEMFTECYVRIYLITVQDNITERHSLGTFLIQSPSKSFNGKVSNITIDAYSPLIELNDVQPPLGFTVMKEQNIMDNAYSLTRENLRAPVIKVNNVEDTMPTDFTAESDEKWLEYISALMSIAKYGYALDDYSRVLFVPTRELTSIQPVWTYDDDNSSILYPDVSEDFDLFGVPNMVEVIYTGQGADGNTLILKSTAVNDNPDSPVSTVARGRPVLHRETNPSISGIPDQAYLDMYANNLLMSLSSIERKIVYSHGYCPVRYGDCVRLNYSRAGLKDIKAKVINQEIECTSGGKVTETAVYATNLWKEGW